MSKKKVLVVAEQVKGQVANVTLELLGEGKILADKLDGTLACFLIGHNLDEAISKAQEAGAEEIYVADHKELEEYRTLPYRKVIIDELNTWDKPPHTLLMGSTTTGRDLAPRIAAYYETGLTADTIELDIGPYEHKAGIDKTKIGMFPECLYANRPSFGESLKARILGPWKDPQMATIRPGVFPMPQAKPDNKAIVKNVAVNVIETDYRVAIKKIVREASSLDLNAADVIVAGGFGLGGADGFKDLETLAGCFDNAVIAASRKAVDLGWIKYEYQVGQTGKTVRPKIYFACGISGALQHRVGMQKAESIIAINKDPDAPVFDFAHHGIVGDLYHVIPEFISKLKTVELKSGNGASTSSGNGKKQQEKDLVKK